MRLSLVRSSWDWQSNRSADLCVRAPKQVPQRETHARYDCPCIVACHRQRARLSRHGTVGDGAMAGDAVHVGARAIWGTVCALAAGPK